MSLDRTTVAAPKKEQEPSIDQEGSRVALLESGQEPVLSTEDWLKIVAGLEIGQIVTGKVKGKTPITVLLDIGGVEAILQAPNLSWGIFRAWLLHDKLKINDELKVAIRFIDREDQRIAVSCQLLTPDPWIDFPSTHPIGSPIVGEVVNVEKAYAILDCDQGVEGVIQVAVPELPGYLAGVSDLNEFLRIGDTVEATIAYFDDRRKQLAFQVDPRQLQKFDKQILKRHHPKRKMEPEVRKVIEAAVALRDVSKESLQEGVVLAAVETSKCREIADAFYGTASHRAAHLGVKSHERSPVIALLETVQEATKRINNEDAALDELLERLNLLIAEFNRASDEVNESSKKRLIENLNKLKAKRPVATVLTDGTDTIPAETKVSLSFKPSSSGYPTGRFVMVATSKDEKGQQPSLARVHQLPIRFVR